MLVQVQEQYAASLKGFLAATEKYDIETLFVRAAEEKDAERFLERAIPEYAAVNRLHRSLTAASRRRSSAAKRPAAATALASDFQLGIAGRVFDIIAKDVFHADKSDCTDWWKPVDLAVGYTRGRACYWFKVSDAHGELVNTTVKMGAQVRAGGKLDIQACVRVPCSSDRCITWSPGIGLRGPLTLGIELTGLAWEEKDDVITALRLRPFASDVPGFEVYGMPPGVEQVVNAIINWISSIALKLFINAILQLATITIVRVSAKLSNSNVTIHLSQFGVTNQDGMLVLSGATSFS
jgi:hypothetical protein